MEYVASLSMFFCGFVVAAVLLLILTLRRCSNVTTFILVVLSILAIVGQGGCLYFLKGVGEATSGQDNPLIMRIFGVGAAILTVWMFAVLARNARR